MRRLVALVVAGLLVAACGGGSDAAAPTTTTVPPATTVAPVEVATTLPAPPPPEPTTTVPPAVTAGPPLAANDPVALAGQLASAERAIRNPATPADQLTAAGHLQQVAYRQLAAHEDWDAAVLANLPADLHGAVQANVEAGRWLRKLISKPKDTLPAWRIVDAAPPDELLGYYREAEATFGVPWPYLAAIHLVETRMGRLRGTSSAGAQGPMQFIPSTWAAYGEGDINDNRDAILAAGRYLQANGAPGNIDNALYRYNPTEKYVNAVKLYADQMFAEPRAYLGYYHWQVYYVTVLGDVLLPVGYEATEPRPVTPEDVTSS